MAFLDFIDPLTPPGTEDVSNGDDRIREYKRAVIERLQSVFVNIDTDPMALKDVGTGTLTPTAATKDIGASANRYRDAWLSRTLDISQGSLTADTKAINTAATWNNVAVTFTHWLVTITDTASAAASKLAEFIVGGVSRFALTKAGTLTLAASLIVDTNTLVVDSATDRVHVGATAAFASEKVGIYRDSNDTLYQLIRNTNAGASAYTALVFSAFGNSWEMGMGSTAANSNGLLWAVDFFGAPAIRMTLSTAGALTTQSTLTVNGGGAVITGASTVTESAVGSTPIDARATHAAYTGAAIRSTVSRAASAAYQHIYCTANGVPVYQVLGDGSVIQAANLTISAGGLSVSGGGANIIGNVAVTGTTTISSTLTQNGTVALLAQSPTTANVTVGTGAGAGVTVLVINGAAGQERILSLQTASTNRWSLYANNVAEGGGNAGSNFAISAYTDAGALIDSPLSIARVAGGSITLARGVVATSTLNVQGAVTLDGNVTLGNAAADAIAFTGELSTNIIPNGNATLSLGSTTRRMNEVHVKTLRIGEFGAEDTFEQTSGVLSATTIAVLNSGENGAYVLVNGKRVIGVDTVFFDVVLSSGGGTPVLVTLSSTTLEGAPAARTYTMSGTSLQLAMGGGDGYDVAVRVMQLPRS